MIIKRSASGNQRNRSGKPVPTRIASKKSSLPEIYNAIVSDLESTITDLPATTTEPGRATIPAAQHLLARVHLTRATMDITVTPGDEYQKAAELSNVVITNPNYKLVADYAKVFEQGTGEANSEVIWSVQYTNDPLTNSSGNMAHVWFLMEYDAQPGMVRDIQNGRPYKRFKPTDYTLALWNRTLDTRYTKNFKQVFLCNKPGSYTIPVGTNPASADPKATVSKNVTLSARELLGEQLRWFDLVRTKTLVNRVKLYNADAKDIKDYHILRPIPQDQIDRTKNTDGTTFEQNPGYQ